MAISTACAGETGVSIAAKPWPGDLTQPRRPWDDDYALE